jgi:hypothetical protein
MINKSKNRKRFKAMKLEAANLGFKSILEAEKAGFSNQLKAAFENSK